jgi:hypothetical protein
LIWAIAIFGVGIVGAIWFLINLVVFFDTEMGDVIEFARFSRSIDKFLTYERYSAVDLYTSFTYISKHDLLNMSLSSSFKIDGTNVIVSGIEKKRVIEKHCLALTKKMLDDGLIEIIELDDEYGEVGPVKTIQLKTKVYKKD